MVTVGWEWDLELFNASHDAQLLAGELMPAVGTVASLSGTCLQELLAGAREVLAGVCAAPSPFTSTTARLGEVPQKYERKEQRPSLKINSSLFPFSF